MTKGVGRGGTALAEAVSEMYSRGQTDYSLEPLLLADDGLPAGRIHDGDAVIFCCRRGEREVELTEAFTAKDFPHFERPGFQDLGFVILTRYHEKFKDLPVAFAPVRLEGVLGEAVRAAGLRQLRIAESEKFAHVTFFLNGGSNARLEGEVDVKIPSPHGLPYDQVPELSLPQVTAGVIQGIQTGYDLIVTNFANGDVIGHTTSREAKIMAAQAVDRGLGQVVAAAVRSDYVVLITADHGNLEVLFHPDGSPHVAHTSNPVACILVDPRATRPPILQAGGSLRDVAPTLLGAMGIGLPAQMDGSCLAPGHDWQGQRKVLLIILDGWGIGKEDDNNPIFLAGTPVWEALLQKYPSTRLDASGEAVGLQPGKPGNSEAGHMNLGAGRIVPQDDARLDRAMIDGSFYTNEILCQTIESTRQKGTALHLMGLLSEKSSHGSIEYPLALLGMAKAAGLERVYLHLILDGRSTEPGSAPALLRDLDARMEAIGAGQVVTGAGRGLALDRDGNYARIQKVFDALVYGRGQAYTSNGRLSV